MSLTQIITTAVFVIAIVFAVLVISGIIPLLGPGLGQKPAQIELWGTFPSRDMELVLNEIKSEAIKFFEINYVEKNPETFESELLNALASGKGPDAWFITQDAILKSKNRLHAIPFASLSERSFNDTFIDGANLFLEKTKERGETGTIAVPVLVDPIVLYVNKDLLSSSGIAKAPEYWDQFLTDIPKLTRKDERGNVTVSGAALGEFENVTNAKEIISMFILERGNPIVDPNTHEVTIRERGESLLDPGENSLGFFNEFSNPNKVSYSWNRSLPESQKAFSAGSLAFYFGYASEFDSIKSRNPHLNFDAHLVPQLRDGKINATFARIYGVGVSILSANKLLAISSAFKFTEKKYNNTLAGSLRLAPIRRDLLAEGSEDPVRSVFYFSAIMGRAWLEPNPERVTEIFKNMVESTEAGRARLSEAVGIAKRELEELLKK